MGWSGGSRLMTEIIEAFSNVKSSTEDAEQFYIKLIKSFEEDDCDNLDECLGEDVLFDMAYYSIHPRAGGENAGFTGASREDNPWTKETYEWDEWNNGWEYGLEISTAR